MHGMILRARGTCAALLRRADGVKAWRTRVRLVALAVVACLAAGLSVGCEATAVPDEADGASIGGQSSADYADANDSLGPNDDGELIADEIIEPAGAPNVPPVAKAGVDLFVRSGDTVTLDGSASLDPDGDKLSYSWLQLSGEPMVEISDPTSVVAGFAAGNVADAVTLTFRLTVSDGQAQDSDVIDVRVEPLPTPAGVLPTVTIEATTTNGEAPLWVGLVALVDGTPPDSAFLRWDFGDGDTAEGQEVEHEFGVAGEYAVTVCLSPADDEEATPSCDTVNVVATTALPPAGGGGGGGVPPVTDPCEADADGDGVFDCDDLCPADAGKSEPGVCGCGMSDADADGDGVADCIDECPGSPDVDSDGDGVLDCANLCPGDRGKTAPGVCGCGVADADTNGNGVMDCVEILPDERTADMPDSWLVLYNLNSADSVTWATWYLDQWGIPAENALGLDVDPDAERIQRDDCVNDIYLAVYDYLDTHPQVAERIMGIVVGYRVPGNYYLDASTPDLNGGGGWSVASKLQHIEPEAADFVKWPRNNHRFIPGSIGDATRLTKATLTPHHYLTARIDAPTLADAQALTIRARAITSGETPLPDTEWLYYDYDDPDFNGGAQWDELRATVEFLETSGPPERYPWRLFESDGAGEEATPDCALRFSFYRLTGWQSADWGGEPSGSRILGYALNSFGATTVRSTTAHNGRYVPNALVNGGFAAAVGATAEPYVSTAPVPATMVWCLADGRTIAEAFYHSNEYIAWMWELDGDPLMRVPNWFGL